MYIKLILMLLMLMTGNSVNAQSEIIGNWENADSGNIIEIYKQDNLFYGMIIKVSGNEPKEKIGHLLLDKLTFNTITKNYNGKVNSTTGMTADCTIELINETKFQLIVTKIFIRRTQIFIRTK